MGSAVTGWGHLQVGDDAVLYVLLLLAQEVEAHSVERVGAELVFPQQHLECEGRVGTRPGQRPRGPGPSARRDQPYLQHVHLHAAHHADHLAVPPAGLL